MNENEWMKMNKKRKWMNENEYEWMNIGEWKWL